jgi:hypothetical protein
MRPDTKRPGNLEAAGSCALPHLGGHYNRQQRSHWKDKIEDEKIADSYDLREVAGAEKGGSPTYSLGTVSECLSQPDRTKGGPTLGIRLHWAGEVRV